MFTSAPALSIPDSSAQFAVFLDASDAGVGVGLSAVSQRQQDAPMCLFFHTIGKKLKETMALEIASYLLSNCR